MLVSIPAHAEQSVSEAELLSRLQSMAGGTYCDAEYMEVVQDIDGEISAARNQGEPGRVVSMTVMKSRTLTMTADHEEALDLLLGLIDEFEGQGVPDLSKAYVEAGNIYAALGQAEEISRLKTRFRNSDAYDGKTDVITGGTGPGEVLRIERPAGGGESSPTMIALTVAEQQARYTGGERFPAFETVSWTGETVRSPDMSGSVVLYDFWMPGWHQWRQDVEYRIRMFNRHADRGFQIVGFCIAPNDTSARDFALRQGIPWTLVSQDRQLMKQLGLFGEVANYLVDRGGSIIGRNLYGSDLEAAVERALR